MTTVSSYFKLFVSDSHAAFCGGRGQLSFLKSETARAIPGALPRNICASLIERIDEEIDRGTSGRVWRDAVGSDCRVLQFERDIPSLLPYFNVARLVAGIDAYVGRSTKSWLLMANRVLPKEGNLGSGGGLHRDSPFSHQVKCIWYLSDVEEENGPFQYIPGTHRNLIGQRHKYPIGTYRYPEIFDPPAAITAPAGTLLVCDTHCIHGGKPIVSGTRYAVTLYTFPRSDGIKRLFESSGLDPAAAASPYAAPVSQA